MATGKTNNSLLKSCKACGTEISRYSPFCRNCGHAAWIERDDLPAGVVPSHHARRVPGLHGLLRLPRRHLGRLRLCRMGF